MSLSSLVDWATLGAFVVPLVALAFSAHRWIDIRGAELKSARFQTYHQLIHSISSGTNEQGQIRLTSQIAFIFEMRNFPEYKKLTETVLSLLRNDWMQKEDGEKRIKLLEAIDETLTSLQVKN